MASQLTQASEGSAKSGSVLNLNKGEVFTSFDVNAFEVPHGRDEIWRFTPLRRLRGLHNGTAGAD
ncbi:Fe-S cluster assembly protein SufD, partial [Mycobacteroides abscessus subsp. abscessus]